MGITSMLAPPAAAAAAEMLPPVARRALARSTTLLRDVATPCYLPPSVMGNVPHLTPDTSAKVHDLRAQLVDFADIVTAKEFVCAKQKSFRSFLNLEHTQLLLTARDYVNHSNPPATKAGFAVETCTGRKLVSPQDYMAVAHMLQPELVIPLADEIACSFGNNRQRAAIASTLEWLDACITHRHGDSPERAARICGVILGGAEERLRRLSTFETCQRDIQAVLISGLDSCASAETRNRLIDVVVDELTTNANAAALPRLVSGIGAPLDVLDAVARGIDGFVSTYPAAMTKSGAALIFWVDDSDDVPERSLERARSGSVLHLRETRFERDLTPLLAGCDCYACRHYTRAYVHHLLNVREILGDVLLYVHNLQQYYRFFRAVRHAIARGTFARFAQSVRDQYDERESCAPPLAVPLAILERRERDEAERAAHRAKIGAEKAAKAKVTADAKKREAAQTDRHV